MKNLKKFKIKDADRDNFQSANKKSKLKKKPGLKADKDAKVKNKKQFYNELYEEE